MTEFNDEPLTRYQGVGGWLLLLCLGLTIFSPLVTVFNLVSTYSQTQSIFGQYPGYETVFYIDAVLSIVLMGLSVRAGIALWTIKPGAVRTAKNYLLIFLGYTAIGSILPFTAGLPSSANDVMMAEVIKSGLKAIAYFGIWYSYLSVSKRVRGTYADEADVVSNSIELPEVEKE